MNKFFTDFMGQTNVTPQIQRLTTDASYSDITEPGFLNRSATAGISFSDGDIFAVKYDAGTQFFIVSNNNGIFTLQVYQAGSQNFPYENMIYVAKGGSDLNVGNQMGYPKLTIQAALNAANSLPGGNPACVQVLDAGVYHETLSLSPLRTIMLYMPFASLNTINTSAALTLNDTGSNYVFELYVNNVNLDGASANAIRVLGPNSNIFMTGSICAGDIYTEGGCVLSEVAIIQSNITIQPSGQLNIRVVNLIASTIINNGGAVYGSASTIPGGNIVYGQQNFNDKITFHQDVKNETLGRTIDSEDSVSTIVYNNATPSTYSLPSTTDQNIPIGTVVEFVQIGLGVIEFSAGPGVTLISTVGSSPISGGLGSKCYAEKISDIIWIVSGDIQTLP